jgi:hypothetical protein
VRFKANLNTRTRDKGFILCCHSVIKLTQIDWSLGFAAGSGRSSVKISVVSSCQSFLSYSPSASVQKGLRAGGPDLDSVARKVDAIVIEREVLRFKRLTISIFFSSY